MNQMIKHSYVFVKAWLMKTLEKSFGQEWTEH